MQTSTCAGLRVFFSLVSAMVVSLMVCANAYAYASKPVAYPDNYEVQGARVYSLKILVNDKGLADGQVRISIVESPANGTAVVNANDSINYVSNPQFTGIDKLVYKITDSSGASASARVLLRVNANETIEDSALVAETDFFEIQGTDAHFLDVLENDRGLTGKQVSVEIVETPSNGEARIAAKNKIEYTPNSQFSGEDEFVYKVTNAKQETALATVKLEANCSNCVSNSSKQVTLTWDANPEPSVTGYIVYYGATPGTATKQLSFLQLRDIDSKAPSVTYHTDEDLNVQAEEQVCLRVRAKTSSVVSKLSKAVCLGA